jgi:hypothetical protein
VKNYSSVLAGVDATIETMKNGYYGEILTDLFYDEDPLTIANAIAYSRWGTHDAVTATQYCIDHTSDCCNTNVV